MSKLFSKDFLGAGCREIRLVDENWQHPLKKSGKYEPLFKAEDLAIHATDETYMPNPENYMPKFENPTYFQAYETTTEGTPISPVFASTKELIDYCAKHCRLWGNEKGTRKDWEETFGLAT